MRILITGGAGFVGSNLARAFAKDGNEVYVLDNLKRRGSELNIAEFRRCNIHFIHGDIRNRGDFSELKGAFDYLVEASAEPSVHAGSSGSPDYVIDTNLMGTINCLEFARKQVHKTIFLSTSRVYSIEALRSISLVEAETRFILSEKQSVAGLTSEGITEDFSTRTARSLYGATKLASELICQEYAAAFGTKILINRCGVIAGPGQFGKVDQGVFTLWVANHVFKKPLRYLGFGGYGRQVRDLLHPSDLFALLKLQFSGDLGFNAEIYNVGGGLQGATSLLELTQICQEISGIKTDITSHKDTAAVDIPYYVTDARRVMSAFNWKPGESVRDIVIDIHSWISQNKSTLSTIFE